MTSHWKAVLGILLIFLLGCASGWLSRSLVSYRQTEELLQHGPEEVARVLEHRMTRNLHLDPEQQRQVHACLMENVAQRKQFQQQIQPQIQTLNRHTLQQINAILRPEQQARLWENITQFRKNFGKSPFNPNVGNPLSLPPPDSTPPAPADTTPDHPFAPAAH